MKNIDLVLLVIASTGEDYYCDFINEYWSSFIKYIEKHNYNIKIFLIFGRGNNIERLNINEKNIIIANDIEENLHPGVLDKTIFGLEYINSTYNYKHILRTNISSFFIIDNLVNINKSLPDSNIYAGVSASTFVSGAGFWLSRDNVNYILNNKVLINYNIIWDDVAIGDLLKTFKKTDLPRYDIYDNIKVDSTLDSMQNHYHIRVKTTNRTEDVIILKKLTNHFYSE